jgi:DNA replication initiation complex subunit (GINS family)
MIKSEISIFEKQVKKRNMFISKNSMDNSEKMFELADRLKALRDEKKESEQSLKDINAELEEVDAVLAQLMTDTEMQNFTRSGTMFCLTNTTRAAAMADRDLTGEEFALISGLTEQVKAFSVRVGYDNESSVDVAANIDPETGEVIEPLA